MDELVPYLKALVLLQLAAMEQTTPDAKPELLLWKAGFSHKDIAELLGKSYAAVAKSISRAK